MIGKTRESLREAPANREANMSYTLWLIEEIGREIQFMEQLRPGWFRLVMDDPLWMQFQFGRLVVMKLNRDHHWLALEEDALGERAGSLGSWQWEESELTPGSMAESTSPNCGRSSSRNGFYFSSKDASGLEWSHIIHAHRMYLQRIAQDESNPPVVMPPERNTAEMPPRVQDAQALEQPSSAGRDCGGELSKFEGETRVVPSAEAYVRALKQLGDRVTPQDRAMLQAHFHAPRREATATQIAGWAFVSGGVPTVNQRYGTLGRALAETLGLAPSSRSRRHAALVDGVVARVEGAARVCVADAARGGRSPETRWDGCRRWSQSRWRRPHATDEKLTEGASMRVVVNAYERNPHARRRCIEHHGSACCICGFDFGKVYGAALAGFIHVHHLRALSDIKSEYAVNPVEDLRPVCPNCHAALHAGGECRSIEEVRRMMGKG
jgi:5-methylcytosine-specific restriction protein A